MVQDEGGLYLAGSGVYGSVAPLRQLPELDSDWGPDCDSCRAAPDTYSSARHARLRTSFLAGLRLSHRRRCVSQCTAFGGTWQRGIGWSTDSPGCAAAGLEVEENAAMLVGIEECACCVESGDDDYSLDTDTGICNREPSSPSLLSASNKTGRRKPEKHVLRFISPR